MITYQACLACVKHKGMCLTLLIKKRWREQNKQYPIDYCKRWSGGWYALPLLISFVVNTMPLFFVFTLNWSFSGHRSISKSQLVSSVCVCIPLAVSVCLSGSILSPETALTGMCSSCTVCICISIYVLIHTVFDMQCQCLFKPVNVSNPVVWWWSRAPVKHPISPHHSFFFCYNL